jgi:hypothetical protein
MYTPQYCHPVISGTREEDWPLAENGARYDVALHSRDCPFNVKIRADPDSVTGWRSSPGYIGDGTGHR